ncbi:MAG: hypothetical protein FWC33_02080 [Candidatus Bathyarchaeota archaeon]|nr:hypothetical protein [Candidatus Termiticorpusculum sp.]
MSKTHVEPPNGTALDVYQFMLKCNKPVGIREITRELNLSSPSVAQHHLIRLENMGFIRREWGNYVINKVVMQNHVKINRFLISRPVLYLFFIIGISIAELVTHYITPFQVYHVTFFMRMSIILICVYEIIVIRRRGQL